MAFLPVQIMLLSYSMGESELLRTPEIVCCCDRHCGWFTELLKRCVRMRAMLLYMVAVRTRFRDVVQIDITKLEEIAKILKIRHWIQVACCIHCLKYVYSILAIDSATSVMCSTEQVDSV